MPQILSIHGVHNPYRQGLRLECRQKEGIAHLFWPLNLSAEELEEMERHVQIHLKRLRREPE